MHKSAYRLKWGYIRVLEGISDILIPENRGHEFGVTRVSENVAPIEPAVAMRRGSGASLACLSLLVAMANRFGS